ncbi:MAG TPA: tetratricopeptide repeat protein [Patescibacteria group bacterium]
MAKSLIVVPQLKIVYDGVMQEDSQPQKSTFFPKIFRFITERGELLVICLVSGFVVIGIVLQIMRLNENLNKMAVVEKQRLQISRELAYWQDIARQYNGYRDAYLKIAGLQYQLGDLNEAKKSNDQALSLDPNIQEGRVLGAKIQAK